MLAPHWPAFLYGCKVAHGILQLGCGCPSLCINQGLESVHPDASGNARAVVSGAKLL